MTIATRMQERCAKLLAQREAELWEQLAAPGLAGSAGDGARDFKEMAARETAATLQQAMERQATGELAQVVAARHRLQQARYGECVDCGEPIDPRRLLALPFTPYCTACQGWSEARR